MNALFSILAMFSGPLGQLMLTGITAGGAMLTTYLVSKGVEAGSAGAIAAGLVSALSAAVQVLTGTRTAQIRAVNSTDNGVRVVPAADAQAAGIPKVEDPQPSVR